MSTQFQLVVIDLMCLVEGAGETLTRMLRSTLRAERIDVAPDDVRAVLGLPVRRATAALLQTGMSLSASVERSDRVHDAFLAEIGEHWTGRGSIREVDGATAALCSLRAQQLRIAIGTHLPRSVVDVILANVGWYDRGLVDTSVTCDEVDDPRPHPGVILEAMRRTGLADARRVLAMGETPANLAEGTLARCGAVVGVTSGLFRRDELELRPHTHLVGRVGDVLDVIAVHETSKRGLELLDPRATAPA